MAAEDILFEGLCYIGFGEEHQRVVKKALVDCFKAQYGTKLQTVKDLMPDLCDEVPHTTFKELLMD